MTGLLIKVEHHPENGGLVWCASMHHDLPKGTEYVPGTAAWHETREGAIAECAAQYRASQQAEPVEWLRYDPTPEPQSLKA